MEGPDLSKMITIDPSLLAPVVFIDTGKPAWKKQWWAGIDDFIEADDKRLEEERKQNEQALAQAEVSD